MNLFTLEEQFGTLRSEIETIWKNVIFGAGPHRKKRFEVIWETAYATIWYLAIFVELGLGKKFGMDPGQIRDGYTNRIHPGSILFLGKSGADFLRK